MSTLAVYPGSFDPLTNGHVDIIMRGARLFDRIIVAILVNLEKSPLFTTAERVEIARAVFKALPNVEVDTFDGLLVDYVQRRQAHVIVRGLRALSDFEYEFQMALMNQRLNGRIETVFMMSRIHGYVQARLQLQSEPRLIKESIPNATEISSCVSPPSSRITSAPRWRSLSSRRSDISSASLARSVASSSADAVGVSLA